MSARNRPAAADAGDFQHRGAPAPDTNRAGISLAGAAALLLAGLAVAAVVLAHFLPEP